jgi:hypothetical protein
VPAVEVEGAVLDRDAICSRAPNRLREQPLGSQRQRRSDCIVAPERSTTALSSKQQLDGTLLA